MSTSATARKAVVIGGGVIGVSCAHYLLREGWQVTLVERATVGSGSSHANCGFICPSHILPLAEPGMVMQGLKSLFARNSPFAIKLRLDPALWSWLLHFAARCNERDMIAAGRGIHALLTSSLALYRELIEHERLDCEFESRGMLFAYRSKHEMEAYAATDRLMTEAFGCPCAAMRWNRAPGTRAGAPPRAGWRLVSSRRCSPAARQADAGLASIGCGPRRDHP